MKVGSVKEIKNNEFRVGLTPDNVRAYVAAGHEVYMEREPDLARDSPTVNMWMPVQRSWIRQRMSGTR